MYQIIRLRLLLTMVCKNNYFKNQLWGELFDPLKDLKKFKKFTLNPFTIEWENRAEFAPEFLYEIANNQINTA
jgi:hypothetical protein